MAFLLNAFVIVACLCTIAETSAASFIKFRNVTGDVLSGTYQGWSSLNALQVDLGLTGIPTSSSTRPSIAVSFSMPVDGSYPQLFDKLARRYAFPTIDIQQQNSVGNVVVEEHFEDAYLTALRLTQTGSGGIVVGEISPRYYQNTFRVYNDLGALVATRTNAWDFINGGVAANSTARLAGDYNADGTVDEADLAFWTRSYGVNMVTLGGGADGNADGLVDAADYTVWRDNYFGAAVADPAATPLPEPAAAAVAGAFYAAGWMARGHLRRNRPAGCEFAG